jgi:hypothetical protein
MIFKPYLLVIGMCSKFCHDKSQYCGQVIERTFKTTAEPWKRLQQSILEQIRAPKIEASLSRLWPNTCKTKHNEQNTEPSHIRSHKSLLSRMRPRNLMAEAMCTALLLRNRLRGWCKQCNHMQVYTLAVCCKKSRLCSVHPNVTDDLWWPTAGSPL